MLSVICPIYNEEKYIGQFMESILSQDYLLDNLEILLVDGMSSDSTREIIKPYLSRYSFIKLLDNPEKVSPAAMNIGIEASRGDYIIRLDAHAFYPSNYFSALIRRLRELNADNVGVVCKTDVLRKNSKSKAIKAVLSNPFGVGNSLFRVGVDETKEVDTVPFGCFPRSTFDRFGLYDERLIRNQDYELNSRIKRSGGKIYIIPDTYCTYYARETFSALWRQNFNNGVWGIRTIKFTGKKESLALRHYIPMIFVLSLIVPFILGFIWKPFWIISFASCIIYVLTVLVVSLKEAIKQRVNIFYLFWSFLTLHISNGCGMLYSLFTVNKYVNDVNRKIMKKSKQTPSMNSISV